MIDWPAFWLTARLALITSGILVAIGVPLAWWLATTRWRGRIFVESVVALPLVLPPTVIGFYVLVGLGPKTWLGQTLAGIIGQSVPFSFAGLVIGSVFYSLPFAVQPFTAGFRGVNRELLEAAWSVGGTRIRTFFRIALPLAWPGLLSGIVLSFAHTLGEFGVVLMIGGNIPGVTRTLSISIYDSVQALDYATAGVTAAALLIFSFVVLSLTYALQKDFRLWPKQDGR